MSIFSLSPGTSFGLVVSVSGRKRVLPFFFLPFFSTGLRAFVLFCLVGLIGRGANVCLPCFDIGDVTNLWRCHCEVVFLLSPSVIAWCDVSIVEHGKSMEWCLHHGAGCAHADVRRFKCDLDVEEITCLSPNPI